MYNHDGHNIFVIDGHMHFWDANPENWKNKYGESWIKCFHAFHSGLSPAEEVWPFDKFCRYGEEVLVNDLFRTGYVDMAILNSTYLYEFYKNGFNSHAQNNVIKAKHPDRFLLCGSFDPRDEEAGVDRFRRMVADYERIYVGSSHASTHSPPPAAAGLRDALQAPQNLPLSQGTGAEPVAVEG